MSGVVILIEITHSKRSEIIFWIVVLSAAIILALKIYFLWYWEPIPSASGTLLKPAANFSDSSTIITFHLEGTHYEEDEVSDVADGLGYNITEYRPLDNGSIFVNATKMDEALVY